MNQTIQPNDENLITIDEVCQLLKVRKSWIYQHTYKGRKLQMPHQRVGRMLRFRKSEVMWYLDNLNKKETTDETGNGSGMGVGP